MPPPTPLPQNLYKILPNPPRIPLPETLPLSDLDANDGFIHLSTSAQVPSTAAKFFADATELYILRCELRGLEGKGGEGQEGGAKPEIRWEEVGRGCFAHLYNGGLGSENVQELIRFERKEEQSWEEVITLQD